MDIVFSQDNDFAKFNDDGHGNVSNNIDPVLLSFMYIIIFLILYFIIDFFIWIISLMF